MKQKMNKKTADEPQVEWLFLDLNSYFATVEQQDFPDLRKEPVAVIPMPTDSTCAIAASYEAKAYGVKTGTKIFDAKRLCPQLKCVLARHDRYVEYHHKIIEEIVRHTPLTKIWSIDECSSRLTLNNQPLSKAKALAQRIKQGIWDNVGEAINCSIGLAPNALLAKIATDIEKPDGLVALPRESLPGRLLELSLSDLPGIGPNMERRLNHAGVWSVKQLWDLAPKQARKIWGSVQGERFWYQLHGYDLPDQETQTRMVGHSRVLDPDMREPDKAYQMCRRLTIKAAQRLRRKEFYASRLTLGVRHVDGPKWGRELSLYPAQDSITFLKALDYLWDEMILRWRPHRLKKVSVALHGLKQKNEMSYDLFENPFGEPTVDKDSFDLPNRANFLRQAENIQQRREQLSNTIEMLNSRYGANTLSFGTPPKAISGYVGTKIAFSRVPDLAEFED